MILNDNLWSVMWRLSWPAVVAMVLYGLNVIFDAIFVGRYVGESALAGVSIAYPLTQLPLGIGSLIGVGAGSYLSILIGRQDQAKQARIVGNVNYLVLVSGILFGIIGLLGMTPMLKIMGAAGTELVFAEEYFRIALFGSIFWIGGIGYNMIIRAEGKMGTAAWMMGVGLITNVIANYIFMAILDMGVKGAAWGTNIGMFVYILLFFIYCHQGKASFPANEKAIYRDKAMVKEILGLGFPSLLMTIMYVIQGIVVLKALNNYGTMEDVAFYGVAFRLYNLFLTPIYGLMRAFQPVAGINFGAGKYERVISAFKIFALVAAILMLPLWLASMIFPQQTLGVMLPTRALLPHEITNFRILVAIAPGLPLMLMAMTFWPAIKKPKPAGMLGIARQAVLYIPAMIILPKLFGIDWIYRGSTLIDAFLCILVVFLIRMEFVVLRKEKVSVEME
ncbi:MATE family efflux transporter [Clostridiales bacterium COT073_COT-073]|nr:MATE family efflux transporter [Clostridiales bacterium COT073_COT-073]